MKKHKFHRFSFATIILILICSIKNNTLKAQDSLTVSFFNQIYNYDFSEAEKILQKASNEKNLSFSIFFLKANYHWWLMISGEEQKVNSMLCEKYLDNAAEILNKKKKYTENELFEYVAIFAYKARLELFEHRYIKAAGYLHDITRQIETVLKTADNSENLKLPAGLYNYFAAQAQAKYPVCKPYFMFCPATSQKKGIDLLEKCTKSDNDEVANEARYFLMKIYHYSELDYPKAEKYATELVEKYPENLMYLYEYYCILSKSKKMTEAENCRIFMKKQANKNSKLTKAQKSHFENIIEKGLSK